MYKVSEKFRKEILSNTRSFTWSGNIILSNKTVINFTEKDILKGSGYIHKTTTSGSELEIGSVQASEFSVTLFSNIDRYSLENSKVELLYTLNYEDKTSETIPMGIFDVKEANRTKKLLELKGYDFMLRFDKSFQINNTYGTAYELLLLSCKNCNVELGMSQQQLETFPNGKEQLSLYTENDIETYRDFIHYIAQVLGGFACINRLGKLVIKRYSSAPVVVLKEKHRYSNTVSDFKTYFTAINSTNMKTKIAEYYATKIDNGLTMNLGVNPLMQLGLEEKRKRMCEQLLKVISEIKYTPFDTVTIGDPSLDLGDMVTLVIDEENIDCLITSIEYKINDKQRIIGVGKNPYLSKAKSKNDKNLVGILNKIETDRFIVHTYTNAKEFELGEKEVLSIEFASDKETTANFHANIILKVVCKTEDKVRVLKDKDKTLELIETIQIPTKVEVTYELNNEKIPLHTPKETYLNGYHTLSLYYPLKQLKEKTINTFSVILKVEDGEVVIEKEGIVASISGESLGGNAPWNGKIKISETLARVPFRQNKLKTFTEVINVNVENSTNTQLEESFRKIQYRGLKLGGKND